MENGFESRFNSKLFRATTVGGGKKYSYTAIGAGEARHFIYRDKSKAQEGGGITGNITGNVPKD